MNNMNPTPNSSRNMFYWPSESALKLCFTPTAEQWIEQSFKLAETLGIDTDEAVKLMQRHIAIKEAVDGLYHTVRAVSSNPKIY